ncbi:hypothetical protein SEA_CAMERICO_84 [Gordonia phage Camerico]|nr:hypothetical protein SEA_CAMERICO_84 [Gordonia phage Camerico]
MSDQGKTAEEILNSPAFGIVNPETGNTMEWTYAFLTDNILVPTSMGGEAYIYQIVESGALRCLMWKQAEGDSDICEMSGDQVMDFLGATVEGIFGTIANTSGMAEIIAKQTRMSTREVRDYARIQQGKIAHAYNRGDSGGSQ